MDTVRDLLYKAFPPPQQPLPLAPPTPDVATVIYWCIGQRCIELGTTSPRPDLDLAEKAEYYRLSQPMQWLLPSLILIWVMVALRSQLMPAYTYLFKGCSRVLQIPQIAAEIIGLSKLPALAIDFARRRTAAFKHSGDRQRKDQQDAGIVGDNQIPEIQPSMMRGSRILREISDEQSSDDTMILRNHKLKCNACPILDSPDDERSVSRQNSSSILDNPVDQGSLQPIKNASSPATPSEKHSGTLDVPVDEQSLSSQSKPSTPSNPIKEPKHSQHSNPLSKTLSVDVSSSERSSIINARQTPHSNTSQVKVERMPDFATAGDQKEKGKIESSDVAG